MHTGLSLVDLLVVAAVMLGVTWAGHRLSGSIRDRRGFFQADGTMPWWAVSASIIATVVSAVTFVSVPAAVFAPSGNLTYFQVILGLALGKVVVARVLARPFYESQNLATSYEYVGARIDPRTGTFSMTLGLLLNTINSGVKLLTASLVLDVISGWGLAGCALFIVSISALWGALAGIKTVIWTDFLLFLLFAAGALFSLLYLLGEIEQPLSHMLANLDAQAKLVLFDFDSDISKSSTIWAGVIGAVCLSIAQGSTQGTWQRVKACRSVNDACKAFDAAALFYVVHVLILGVGLALFAFYGERGLPESMAAQLVDTPDRIFPYFIATELPTRCIRIVCGGHFYSSDFNPRFGLGGRFGSDREPHLCSPAPGSERGALLGCVAAFYGAMGADLFCSGNVFRQLLGPRAAATYL